jgi:hypothetical protein
MSLVWDLQGIENWKDLCWVPAPTEEKPDNTELHYVTSALIWGSTMVGFSKITDSNMRTFYRRMLAIEQVLHMSWLHDEEGQDLPLTLDMIEAHKNLSTNVTELTTQKFNASLIRMLDRQVTDKIEAIGYVMDNAAPEIKIPVYPY